MPHSRNLGYETQSDFQSHSVILKVSDKSQSPQILYIGNKLLEECRIAPGTYDKPADIPTNSLLNCVLDHYPQLLATQSPVGFEAEYNSPQGYTLLYRGILLPFADDDGRMTHVLGVINWKEVANSQMIDSIQKAIGETFAATSEETAARHASLPMADWADGPARTTAEKSFTTTVSLPAHLSEQLRALSPADPAEWLKDDTEFALVIIRRGTNGEVEWLGPLSDENSLLEQAAKKLVTSQ
ncbi:hypothetical protein D6851_03575 [Altericroceibacterium spongiae]|uniref:PAS domain-containing protein n=2 Tax=Altericroceibacterium spongiae TaxID=2320269 RepID=A0A420ENP6_9SPHN|nr:hypothetical protein D6851_03575 [Altericroceibacterium spongiae]